MAVASLRQPSHSVCVSASSPVFTGLAGCAPDDASGLSSACAAPFSRVVLHALWHPQRIAMARHMDRPQGLVTAAASPNRTANLHVKQRQTLRLPTLTDSSGTPQPLSTFLQQPAGLQSMLNTKALQHFEYVGANVFRCYLPKVALLNFEVAPVVDLFVSASESDCRVEMLSCKFVGSEAVEAQNNRFSASLKNHLTWQSSLEGEPLLDVNVELNISLEVYTLPFTLLPLSAVETPGNAIMKTMLDRLVMLFVDHLILDYHRWVEEEADNLQLKSPTVSESLLDTMPVYAE